MSGTVVTDTSLRLHNSVVFLSPESCFSSLVLMTSSVSAMGTCLMSEVATKILTSSSLILQAFLTKSSKSLTKAFRFCLIVMR